MNPSKPTIIKTTIKSISTLDGSTKRFGMDVMPEELANYTDDMANMEENVKNVASTSESLRYTLEGNYSGTYDKKTEGRDTFRFNAFSYYKISDFTIAYKEIKRFRGTNFGNIDYSTVSSGENCVECGMFIVVNTAGRCGITIGTTTLYFTAPSTGLYARYAGDANNATAGKYNFTFDVTVPIVTNPNTRKKYYITVDDSGTLSATEVT